MNTNFITCIDDIVMESQINVYNSFYDYYHKMYMLTEYSNDVFTEYCGVFQEQLFLESDTTTKKKKNIINRIIDVIKNLITVVSRAVKRFISKHFGNKKSTSTDISNDCNRNIEVNKNKLNRLISFTNKLLKINISNDNIKYDDDKFSELFYDIMTDEEVSEVKPVYIQNKLNEINKLIDSINVRISEVDKCVDRITDNVSGSETVQKFYEYCDMLKNILNQYISMVKDINKVTDMSIGKQITNISDYMNGPNCFVYKKDSDNNLDINIKNELFRLMKICRGTKDYTQYKMAHDKLCDMIGFHRDVIFMPGTSALGDLNGDYLLIRVNSVRETSSILLKPGTELYYTSSKRGLTHLKPTFKAGDDSDKSERYSADSMYPSSRVYFFLRNPGSRTSTSNDSQFSIDAEDNETYVYKYTVKKPLRVKIDTEATYGSYRKAVFIETIEPIPVEDVTDQFRRTK